MSRLIRFVAWLAALCTTMVQTDASGQEAVSPHLTLGNPTQAVKNPKVRDNFLIVHDECCISFNATTGLCNWVSWRLAGDDIGSAERAGMDFKRDDALPEDYPKGPMQLYANSGFDKGHVMPYKDRSKRIKSGRNTFLSTNCMPQAPKVNRGPWGQHEQHRRDLALAGKELYVVAGPAGRGGNGEKGFRQALGRESPPWSHGGQPGNGFDVPAWCWAAAVMLDDRPGNDLKRITKKTPTVAVIMPNTQDIDGEWQNFQHSISDVEQLTGFDLFDLVDEDIQEAIESAPPHDSKD
jgi:endonuclease G